MKNNIYILLLIFIIIYVLFRVRTYDKFENQEETIPKIIWSHWDNLNTLPAFTKNTMEERNKKLSDWTIISIDNTNINKYINDNDYPEKYNTLGIQHQADWIRLFLLKKYGGLWLDMGIIINSGDEINKIYLDSIKERSELTAFYLNGRLLNNNPMTYIENWFIMAPKNSRVINAWFDEFNLAINMGFLEYRNYITNLGVDTQFIYFSEDDTYLTMHAAIQKIIQLNIIDTPRIKLYKAEDTMYKIHELCNWDIDCIKDTVKNDENTENIPFIKLRGIDRP